MDSIYSGCLTGMIILLISKGKSSHILRFDEELFFIYLLPPIIFNAGFQVKKKQFFQNFLTIMLFGVVGVLISTSVIAAGSWWLFPKVGFVGLTARDYLAIGTIFSSTDTVCTLQVLNQEETPLLYSLVFGEGVVNDATSVVLFNAIQKLDVKRVGAGTISSVFGDFLYLFFASTALGITTGLVTAYALKALYFGRHSTDREIALMVLMAYLSYTLAELLQLSGILTVFFCGIVMSHYAWHNITENSRITTRHIFATMSFIAETFIFLYVGTDIFDIEKWKMTKLSVGMSVGIYATVVLLILLGRAAFVFPLSAISNRMNRDNHSKTSAISFRTQVIIWWAGLMRGAVSIALAFKQVFGFLTKPLVLYLVLHTPPQESKSPKEDLTLPILSMDESAATNLSLAKDSLAMLIERPVHIIHAYWRKFDDAYMRPTFGGPHSNQPR
ncbi:hypothetical protein RND81_12G192100 [Saponaria officinalis]|uniref:Cation/H+ exchanger transmembrane domain-containing protein n=1 Tax=Saponaria officinalis TaxID=3572 RepID=A0AAW1HCL9_SAPOF